MKLNNPDLVENGKATRFPHNNPTKGGRRPSIKKALNKLLSTDGLLFIPDSKIKNRKAVSTDADGKETTGIFVEVANDERVAYKLQEWMNSNKGALSLKAIQMIMEQTEGKPTQPVDMNIQDFTQKIQSPIIINKRKKGEPLNP